ncbi:MAG TPA: hypothetical protein VFS41_12815, partial [Edaphobacter sp.]|nr:hypothetical protein [Edaphobacter sp.]
MPTNDHDLNKADKHHGHSPDAPGYETTDVNVNGVVVFLSGLAGSVFVFFIFCFLMGKVINSAMNKADGPNDKWHQADAKGPTGLASNPQLEQHQLQKLTATFPEPRLDIDDGNQSTADLHAREDLLLEH